MFERYLVEKGVQLRSFKGNNLPWFQKASKPQEKIGTSIVGFSTGEFLKGEFPQRKTSVCNF